MKNAKPVLVFVVGSIVLTWAVAVGYAVMAGRTTPMQTRVVSWICMVIPGLVAVIVNRFVSKQKWFSGLGFSVKFSDVWYAALYVPFGIALLATLLGLLFPDVVFGAKVGGRVFLVLLFQWAFGGLSFFGILALAEQLGWRGLLYREFAGMGFWKSSLLIGLLWGICRAPVMAHGDFASLHGIALMLLAVCWCTLLSPVLHLLRIRTGSILPVAVFVGLMNPNTLFQLPYVLTYGYTKETLLVGVGLLSGVLALLMVDLVILLYYRRKPEYFSVS